MSKCAPNLNISESEFQKPIDEPKNIRVWGWVWKDKRFDGDLYIPSYTPAQHVANDELLALVDPKDLYRPLENTKWDEL